MYNWALRYVGALVVSIAFLGEPQLAAALGLALLANVPSVSVAAGGVLILAGLGTTLGSITASPHIRSTLTLEWQPGMYHAASVAIRRGWERSMRWLGSWAGVAQPAASSQVDQHLAGLDRAAGQLERAVYQLQVAQQRLRYASIRSLGQRSGWDQRDLSSYESSVFSQNGEDGVLQEILHRIGVRGKFFVEIGAHATEANCLVLADILGWRGCFLESDGEHLEHLRRKYEGIDAVTVVAARVTADNIDALLDRCDVAADVDVMSIDVDGNDYWLWRGLQRYRPRVIVIEYNASLPAAARLVQPYETHSKWDGSAFFGASRAAMVELAHAKGYRLVHCDIAGVNLFFVCAELAGNGFLPESEVASRPVNYALSAALHPAPSSGRAYVEPPFPAEAERSP